MRLLHDSSNRLPGIGPAMTWKSILCQCEEIPWGCLTLLPLKGIAMLQSHIFQQAQSHLLELRTPSATRKTHIFIHIDCRSIRVNIPNYNNFSCREQKNLKIWKKINKKRPQVVLKNKQNPHSTYNPPTPLETAIRNTTHESAFTPLDRWSLMGQICG